ncbi:hypothetical protein LY78DRAFT_304636 [Colletotrichum sublineola]|nr:hypothetical protein LY78DRAFT_304636 [Colletotrichum sublineola]
MPRGDAPSCRRPRGGYLPSLTTYRVLSSTRPLRCVPPADTARPIASRMTRVFDFNDGTAATSRDGPGEIEHPSTMLNFDSHRSKHIVASQCQPLGPPLQHEDPSAPYTVTPCHRDAHLKGTAASRSRARGPKRWGSANDTALPSMGPSMRPMLRWW